MARKRMGLLALTYAGAAVVILAVPGSMGGIAKAGAAPTAWPLEKSCEVLTAFGDAYVTSEGESTHRGVDVAASAGRAVSSPLSGSVTFVGTVPGVGVPMVLISGRLAADRVDEWAGVRGRR
jgi:murein DD-endopeptidase MepM/ murein hydrolase activator NlpD